MIWLLARWKLLSAATAVMALVGYIGVLNVQLASERATVAMLNADLASALSERDQCNANLVAAIIARGNRDESESLSIDDLRDGLPAEWMRRGPLAE